MQNGRYLLPLRKQPSHVQAEPEGTQRWHAGLPQLTWCMGDCCGPCWVPCCPPCCAPCCCCWPCARGGGACWGCCAGAGAGAACAGGGALYPAGLHMQELRRALWNAQRPSSLDMGAGYINGSRVMLKATCLPASIRNAVRQRAAAALAAHAQRRHHACMHDGRPRPGHGGLLVGPASHEAEAAHQPGEHG